MSKSRNIFPFKKPEENSGFLLWQVTMHWQRQMKQGLDKIGLTHTQFVLLAALQWLSQELSEVNQIDVANHAQVDKMMTSKVVKTLLDKQLVKIKANERDKRAKPLVLTRQGKKTLEDALAIVRRVDTKFFLPLQNKEGDYQHIMRLLLKEQD
ncbi:MAG: MarR family winged helix-turn-helix transcriptional regulator [Cyclobacteriaceae bacterium]